MRRRIALPSVLSQFLAHVAWACVCLLAVYVILSGKREQLESRFDKATNELAAAVESKLVANDAVLDGFAAFLQAVEQDDLVSTVRYAEVVKAAHPHISTLEVARQVRRDELAAFQESLRRSWYAGFTVRDFAGESAPADGAIGSADLSWPIVFIYPAIPEASKIYGVRLETVGYLARTLGRADLGENLASPVFRMLQGESAYILLRHIVRQGTQRADKPLNFFGTSMMAMLVIRTSLLVPLPADERIALQARLAATGFAESSVLREHRPEVDATPLAALLPRFAKQRTLGSAAQRVTLDFAQQSRWQDLLELPILGLLLLIGGIYVVVAVMAFRQRQSASLLRYSFERLSYAQQIAGAGLWDWDLASGRHSWSDEFFHLCGLDPAIHRAGYKAWHGALHPDDRKAVARLVGQALHDGSPLFAEYRILLPNSQVRWLEAYGQVRRNERGVPVRFTGMCLDVTRRKTLEAERERYRKFFNSSSDLMSIIRADGVRQTANPAFAATLGYPVSELSGKPFVELVHPEERQALLERGRELTANGGAASSINRFICRDGSVRWLAWNATDSSDEQAIYSVARDITEQRAAEAALLAAKEAAENASQTKSEFLAAVSHDLRQPAIAITLFADALANSGLAGEQRDFVRNIERAARSLNEMLNLLLSVARLNAGALEARLEAFPSGELFAWIEHEFAELFLARQLRFKLHFPARELVLRTDPELLREIMRNLIGNALKFTTTGGVLIGLRRRGGQALIQVWDTGIGIAPEHLERIFDEYYQVENRERSSDKGIGLGLTIVARKTALIGAQVTCRSLSGRGSVFELRVPLDDG